MKNNLHLYNSISGEKEKFVPLNPPFVGMYVCGPTVYSYVHLGNARTFISFDLVNRYLKKLGYNVRYVRNITDAGHLENDADEGEDKIAKKARIEQLEPMEIVQYYTLDFHEVLRKFNTIPPSIEPTATGHIVEQIDMVQDVLSKGLAYEINGSVYFDVVKYNEKEDYGALSGRNIEDLMSGTRDLDGQSEKKNAVDFALWKKASPQHIMKWTSPWGEGFPGWHLECSVMSSKYLGDKFDIHGGGLDLKFPHHECEIAQGNAAHGEDPVSYWMHANMLTLNGAKMSKSIGNTLMPNDLFTGDNKVLSKAFSPAVVRFFMMQAHYRSVLDFSNDALLAAEKGFHKLQNAFFSLDSLKTKNGVSSIDVKGLIASFYTAMNDDFNSPILVAKLFDTVKFINSVQKGLQQINETDLTLLRKEFQSFTVDVLGLVFEKVESEMVSDKFSDVVNMLIEMRAKAKKEKNFELADQIRLQLADKGILLKDSREGTTFEVE